MDNLQLKVDQQSKEINEAIFHFQVAIVTLKENSSMYYTKELKQKVEILGSFIDILQDLKIKQL